MDPIYGLGLRVVNSRVRMQSSSLFIRRVFVLARSRRFEKWMKDLITHRPSRKPSTLSVTKLRARETKLPHASALGVKGGTTFVCVRPRGGSRRIYLHNIKLERVKFDYQTATPSSASAGSARNSCKRYPYVFIKCGQKGF